MTKYIISAIMFLIFSGLIYNLGQKKCEIQNLTVYQEKQKNVKIQKAQIYARPNADRAVLLELMRNGTL